MLSMKMNTLVLGASLVALAACSGGSDDEQGKTSTPASKEPATSTDPATPATPAAPAADKDKTSSLGADCTAYLACCDEIAKSTPSAAAGCDAMRKQLEDAKAKGTATTSFESTCKQALASTQSAGYCK